ncbi:TIGR03013 family XrtA/PEP-CTERM system glycosyltransferase [Duganella callida]|uniref:TIGR03013 family PEP-CTERM/XrtA system glycosyltransferase n=1 Tax=Duganella callida TaxID=2561932 RepID=A0A4Y9S7M7_9BURK|nr:TIGR03013 family XrtA/PEP-CTERM system glycosyltransferase [Duganella callida]TFW17283.1 TIGR03013 family PEP-CTERM/XrtA system glycosyltransferase [Duganella callida]
MFKIANHYVSKVVVLLLFLEFFILIGAFYAGADLTFFDRGTLILPEPARLLASSLVFAGIIVFSMSALGMYQLDFEVDKRMPVLLWLLPSFFMGFCLIMLACFLAPTLYIDRSTLPLVFAFSAGGIVLARATFLRTSQSPLLESRILVMGTGQLAAKCGELAQSGSGYRKYKVVGYLPMASEEVCVPANRVIELAPGQTLLQLAQNLRVSEIVVSVQNRRGGVLPIRELLEFKLHGLKVTDTSDFFERETCQIRVESVQPSWLVFNRGFDQGMLRRLMKRGFDLTVSAVIMVLTLPLMLVTALCVAAEDGGPVFYQQERVGKNGVTFKVLKFRSMGIAAEQAGKPQWAQANDPRITRVGNVIRKLRIDELPQLLNVFKGEMSFVGPRPERPYFVEQLNQEVPYYNARHSIKPGITGWAQVRYGYGASVEDAVQKLQYDLYYVKNNSLFLDFLILIDTLKVVMFRGGR